MAFQANWNMGEILDATDPRKTGAIGSLAPVGAAIGTAIKAKRRNDAKNLIEDEMKKLTEGGKQASSKDLTSLAARARWLDPEAAASLERQAETAQASERAMMEKGDVPELLPIKAQMETLNARRASLVKLLEEAKENPWLVSRAADYALEISQIGKELGKLDRKAAGIFEDEDGEGEAAPALAAGAGDEGDKLVSIMLGIQGASSPDEIDEILKGEKVTSPETEEEKIYAKIKSGNATPDDIKRLQTTLGVDADGDFGERSKKAYAKWSSEHPRTEKFVGGIDELGKDMQSFMKKTALERKAELAELNKKNTDSVNAELKHVQESFKSAFEGGSSLIQLSLFNKDWNKFSKKAPTSFQEAKSRLERLAKIISTANVAGSQEQVNDIKVAAANIFSNLFGSGKEQLDKNTYNEAMAAMAEQANELAKLQNAGANTALNVATLGMGETAKKQADTIYKRYAVPDFELVGFAPLTTTLTSRGFDGSEESIEDAVE